MADYINNVAAQDKYVDALTLGPAYESKAAVITVANNPVLMQFAVGEYGNWRWTDEREFFSIPQSFRVGNIIGVKFRNANAGQVARVLAVLSGDEDPDFQSGLPFTGTLSPSGSINPGGGSMQVIQRIGPLVAPQASFDFQGIPATFNHLKLIATLRGDTAAFSVNALLRLNGDAAANYAFQRLQIGGGAAVTGSDNLAQTSVVVATVDGATPPAGWGGMTEILIPDYAGTVLNKLVQANDYARFAAVAAAANQQADVFGGAWANPAAVNQVTLLPSAGNWDVGSTATLYGF